MDVQLLSQFARADQGDETARAALAEREKGLAELENKRSWTKLLDAKLEELKRPKRIPHHSGALLPPTLYNPPLPRYKPVQPIKVTMMIYKRRLKRLRRMERLAELDELMDAQAREDALLGQLDPKHEAGGFEAGLLAQRAAIQETFERDYKRAQMVFDPKILVMAKRARLAKRR